MVPDRAQACCQALNVVFFRLGFLQVHHVHDGVEHFVQKRLLHWIAGLASHEANRLGFTVVIFQVVQFTDVVLNSCGTLFSLSF